MDQENCNCIICAEEFLVNDMEDVALTKINTTKFKICKNCFSLSDPENDYKQARAIVDSYVNTLRAKADFHDVKSILNSMI